MHNPFNFFNLSDFKKWVTTHSENENENNSIIGKKIKAKSGIENFDEKISLEMGDEYDVVKQFLEFGGIVTEQDGNKFLIEVDAGSFVCHKRFLKRVN